jgi:hypothetical protein
LRQRYVAEHQMRAVNDVAVVPVPLRVLECIERVRSVLARYIEALQLQCGSCGFD